MSSLKSSLKRALGREKKYNTLAYIKTLTPDEILRLDPNDVSSEVFEEYKNDVYEIKLLQRTALEELEKLKKLKKQNVSSDIYHAAFLKAYDKFEDAKKRHENRVTDRTIKDLKKSNKGGKRKTSKRRQNKSQKRKNKRKSHKN